MEIKINVTSNEEDRKNVELFEFRRRKEEEFKHKIEEQMNFWGDFTKKTALSNYTILMMLSIRGERKLSFFVCNAKRRQSDVIRPTEAKEETRPERFR